MAGKPTSDRPGASGSGPRRRPTLQDIAEEAGVSGALVSMVLRDRPGPSAATAAKVHEVAQRLGYRANRTASQLARTRTHLLGVTMTPTNPYHGELVEEILARTHQKGYEVVLAAVTRTQDERRSIETLVDSRCEALVLLGPTLPDDELAQAVDRVPAVSVGRTPDHPGIDVVRTADTDAMELLVEHLVSLGHTRIAHVDGGDLPLPADRREGYERAMRARHLQPLVIRGGETEERGAAAAAELLSHPGVTAAVAYNDLCAIGIIDHLYRKGLRPPANLSVTGFDDDRLAGLGQIDLTTINPAKLEQARIAVELALDGAEGRRTGRTVRIVPPRLVPRGSTATPPA